MQRTTIQAKLQALQQDREHGASELADHVLAVLCEAAAHLQTETAANYRVKLRAVARSLARVRPSMAVLANVVAYCYAHAVVKAPDAQRRELYQRLLAVANEVRRRRQMAQRDVADRVRAALPDSCRLLTHSRSSTVERVLRRGGPHLQRIWVTESLPGGEGRAFAAALTRAGLPATVVPDADVKVRVGDVDLVLVGADTVLRNGAVVNKVGTYDVAAAAARAQIPVLVVCDTWKISPRRSVPLEHASTAPGSPVPPLFDRTPARFLKALFTERGPISPAKAYRWAQVTSTMVAALQ